MDVTAQVEELVSRCQTCQIGAVDSNGFPQIKAMLMPRQRDGLKVIYFSTNTSSQHVAQYRQNPKACLYFYSAIQFQGVLLTGAMEVLEDPIYKERLWQTGDTRYYPQGVTDPDYCVLRFTAQHGRMYSGGESADFIL